MVPFLILAAVLTLSGVAAAQEPPTAPVADTTEQQVWRGTPIRVDLRLNTERTVRLPGATQLRSGLLGGPVPGLRVQALGDHLYLKAEQPFAATRLIVQPDAGQSILLDLAADQRFPAGAPLEVLTNPAPATGTAAEPASLTPQTTDRPVGYVALVRHAAQSLYAPTRLIPRSATIARAPLPFHGAIDLVRGGPYRGTAGRSLARQRSPGSAVARGDQAAQHPDPTGDAGSARPAWPVAGGELPACASGRHGRPDRYHHGLPGRRPAPRGRPRAVRAEAGGGDAMITMNRVIPIIGGIVLVIAVAVAVKSGERRPKPDLMAKLPTAAAPDVDTPADTVRSLSAQVAQMVDQTRRLTEENQKLREQNAAAMDQEKRVADKVRAELANDIERAGRRDDKTLTALSQQLEKLRSRIAVSEQTQSTTPALADMPVGFGYGDGGIAGAIHWIEALDAPAAGTVRP